jgi:hypothetical protein
VNAERDESQQYHHDPDEGETHGAERDGDPHDPLNTPLEAAPAAAPGQEPEKEGMGGNPPARGERVARRPMPPQDD